MISIRTAGILLAAAVSICTISALEGSSDMDWYRLFKKQSRTEDDNMDREMFGLGKKRTITGRVQTPFRIKGVGGATVRIFTGNILTGQTITDGNGLFSISAPPASVIRLEVSKKNFATGSISLSRSDFDSPVLIRLLAAYEYSLNRNRSITVTDNRGMVSLTVHASVLKRQGGGRPRFPVRIQIAYIDPAVDLAAMPGRQMLADTGIRGIMPLLSYGAALIEAMDADGKRIVVDRQAMRRLGRPTELRFNMRWLVDGRDMTDRDMPFSGWQVYPGKDNWEPSDRRPEPVFTRIRGEQGGYRQTKWKTSVLIRAVELTAFNLDVPKQAVPIALRFRQSGGTGTYLVTITGISKKGRFEASQFFNTGKTAYLRMVVPALKQLTVGIRTAAGQRRPVYTRTLRVPGKPVRLRLNKKKETVTDSGSAPAWRDMGLIRF